MREKRSAVDSATDDIAVVSTSDVTGSMAEPELKRMSNSKAPINTLLNKVQVALAGVVWNGKHLPRRWEVVLAVFFHVTVYLLLHLRKHGHCVMVSRAVPRHCRTHFWLARCLPRAPGSS